MAKYLHDVWIRASRTYEKENDYAFGLSSNFLIDLYSTNLPKVQTNGFFRIIVEANPTPPTKKIENMVDVLQINKVFDFEAYFAADKETRKRIALELLQDGLLEVAEMRGWNTTPFHEAYKAVLAKNFVNYRPWCKFVRSPDKKRTAQAWVNYDSDKAEIFIEIAQKKEKLTKTLVTTVKPGDVWIRWTVGKLEWISLDKVRLTSHDGKETWEVSVPTSENY